MFKIKDGYNIFVRKVLIPAPKSVHKECTWLETPVSSRGLRVVIFEEAPRHWGVGHFNFSCDL